MPQPQTAQSVENNFTQGLKTEHTALNFPENAATDTRNCIFSHVGNVIRRPGIDYELHNSFNTADRSNKSISQYKWNNAGGTGLNQVLVCQIGSFLHFYISSEASVFAPLSNHRSPFTINLSDFLVAGSPLDPANKECQYSDGDGYLFVVHPYLDPFYVTYGSFVGKRITVKIRDFIGIQESVDDTFRPVSLTNEHKYNLYNQGWSNIPSWTASSSDTVTSTIGSHTWNVQAGLTISNGQVVNILGWGPPGFGIAVTGTGTVTGYSGTSLTINVTSFSTATVSSTWTFSSLNTGTLDTWFAAEGNYPSNSDVWWLFKNASGVFDPATTVPNITLNSGPAPKGFFILSAFNQDRSTISGVGSLSTISTQVRPKTTAWFQGRVWYSGADDTTFNENIYFSQIIERSDQFGKCYQVNDPTSEDRFDILPSDGGLIKIQGCGSIYKLFPIQNGLIVFAANGIWFITGSQGIGFTAVDYTVVKVSSIQSISGTSYVDVQGYPMWWNAEGIYALVAASEGLTVQPLSYGTIQSFYDQIPLESKKYARGAYDPLDWTLRWIYRTEDLPLSGIPPNERYEFDGILMFNTATKSFSPWVITNDINAPKIHGIQFIQSPGGSSAPPPILKYFTSLGSPASAIFTFSEENDFDYVDWESSGTAYDYSSYFITGYKLHNQALRRWQPNYVIVYSNNEVNTAYEIQGIWNFAISGNSGKFGSQQYVEISDFTHHFGKSFRKHRIRGLGTVLQFKIQSVSGQPFDISGWAVEEKLSQGM
jgi:hypothetical protein